MFSLISWRLKDENCKSVLVRFMCLQLVYVVVVVYVMSMLDLLAFDFVLDCVVVDWMFCWVWSLHSPLRGKRSLGVKGLVGLDIEVEKSFSWRGDSFMEYGIHWSHMPFYCSMGGISEDMWRGVSVDRLVEACVIDSLVVACFLKILEYCNCKIWCFIRIWHSPAWRAHLNPMFMIPYMNHCASLGWGF